VPIPNSLTLHIDPPPSPCSHKHCPTLLKAIARGFLLLVHVYEYGPSTIFPHFHLLHSPSHKYPHCNYFIVLSFIINSKINIQRGSLWCISTMNIPNFGQFNPLCYSPLPLSHKPHYPTVFSTYHYVLYLQKRNAFQYCWLSSFCFNFLPPSSAIE
jgi:hypothetical protein